MKQSYLRCSLFVVITLCCLLNISAQITLHDATNVTQTKATLSADFPDNSTEHGFQYKYGTLPEIDEFSKLALSPTSDPVLINNKSSYPWSARSVKGWIESNPNVAIGQSSTISIDVTVYQPTNISFEWSTDSEEDAGILTFYVDNNELESISGFVEFQPIISSLDTGKHTLTWSYRKVRPSNLGLDLGMIRNISIGNTTYGKWSTELIDTNEFQLTHLYPRNTYLYRAICGEEYSSIKSFSTKEVSCDTVTTSSITQSTITLASNISFCDAKVERGFIIYKDINPLALSLLSSDFSNPEFIDEIDCDSYWHINEGKLVLDEPKTYPLILSVSLPDKMIITFDWSIKGSYHLIVGAGQRWEKFYPVGELYIDDESSKSASIKSKSSSSYNSSKQTITLGKGKHILKFTADHTGATLLLSNLNITFTQNSTSGGGASSGFEINRVAPRKITPFENPLIIVADGTEHISSKISNLTSDHEYWIRSYIKPLYSNSMLEQAWNGSYSPLAKFRTLPVYPHTPTVTSVTQSTATIAADLDNGDAEILSGGLQYMNASGTIWADFPIDANHDSKHHSITINRLKPNTRYSCRAYLQAYDCDTVYSDVYTFLTAKVDALKPSIRKLAQHEVALEGKVVFGDASIYQRGMQFRKKGLTNWEEIEDGGNDSIYTLVKKDLEMGVTYQARTYVQPAGCNILYSEILEFKTLDTYFTKCNSNARTQTSVTFEATLADTDDDATINYGFEYYIDSDGFFENANSFVNSDIFDIPAIPNGKELKTTLTGLTPSINIRWRAYAQINGIKTYFTSNKNWEWDYSYTCEAYIKATVKKITQTSIFLELDPTQDGDAVVSQVEYALANSVQETGSYSICGNTLTLNNLVPNKQYNLRFRGLVNGRYCPLLNLKNINCDYSWFEYKTLPITVNVSFSGITQTKAKMKVSFDRGDAEITDIRYRLNYDEILPYSGEQTLTNLVPGRSYSVTIYAKVNGEDFSWTANSSDNAFRFTTKSVYSTVSISETYQTAAKISWNSIYGDATFVSFGLEIGSINVTSESESGERTFNELTPHTSYSCRSYVETLEGGRVYSPQRSFSTKAISTVTSDVSNISNRSATMNGEINCDSYSSAEFGFQWKQMEGWYSDPAFTKGHKLEDGSISVGLVNGMLEPNTDYQYRTAVRYHDEIYTSNDWKTFRTESEFIYYPASVYTIFRTDRENNALILCGYYVSGSETIVSQGYEYWSLNQPSSRMHAPQNAIVITTDETMQHTFTDGDLKIGNYAVRAFVKTESGETLYGATLEFRVSESGYAGIEGVDSDDLQVFIEDSVLKVLNGHGQSCFIFNLNGIIVSERTDMEDYEEFHLAKDAFYIVKFSTGKVLKLRL